MPRQTIEQERARMAFQKIQEVNQQNYKKEYLSYVRSASSLIVTNGLLQTLAFWNSKAKGNSESSKAKGNSESSKAYNKLLIHLTSLVLGEGVEENALIELCLNEDTGMEQYRQYTKIALAVLIWLKRFAEAELS